MCVCMFYESIKLFALDVTRITGLRICLSRLLEQMKFQCKSQTVSIRIGS